MSILNWKLTCLVLILFFNLSVNLSFLTEVRASDFQSPRTQALGGSGHAGPLLSDPIYLNPSFTSLNQSYTIGLSYLKYGQGDYHGRDTNVSIQDGRTELFQAGAGYTSRADAALVHISASKSLFPFLSTGLGGKFAMSKGQKTISDAVASFGGPVNDWFQWALVVDNLMESADGKTHGFYREIVAGTKFNVMGIVLAYVDPHFAPSVSGANAFGHEMGLEFPLMKDLFLRVGMFRNSNVFYQNGLRGNGWGAGIGWVAPRISLDYAMSRVNTTLGGLRETLSHNFGATVFF